MSASSRWPCGATTTPSAPSTSAGRAALALTEAATRLPDRGDAVPDEVWNEAARHYDEKALADLVLNIALINFRNRANVTIRQVSGVMPEAA